MSDRFIRELESQGILACCEYLPKSVLKIIKIIDSLDDHKLAAMIFTLYGTDFFHTENNLKSFISNLPKDKALSLHSSISSCDAGDCTNPWDSLNNTPAKTIINHLNNYYFNKPVIQPHTKNEYLEKELSVEPNYLLYPYQLSAYFETKALIIDQVDRAILHIPTGGGKTRIGMHIVCEYLKNNQSIVFWIADTKELCDQAFDEFQRAWRFLGNRKISMLDFYGNNPSDLTDIKNDTLVVASVHKINKWLNKGNNTTKDIIHFSSRIGLTVFDEAHKILAPTYQRIVTYLTSAGTESSLLGLSATPGRDTFNIHKNQAFADFFHANKITLTTPDSSPIAYLQSRDYLSKPTFHQINYNEGEPISPQELRNLTSGMDFSSRTLKRLGEDAKRNLKIIECIQSAEEDNSVIVFAPSVDSATAIFAYLKLLKYKVTLVTSKSNAINREASISGYLNGEYNIIVNYGVLTTGFDAPKTNVCVIGRPTTSISLYSQMVGRAMRGKKSGGTETCQIYTLVDNNLGFNDAEIAFTYFDRYFD
ncbi:DEAD/DEAH box helicase [Thiomicrospira microaerophila]|uniref:DEAD/DEAH box helicase n=1 Tax=Thiomicrospira microaerophila TaxID=406020 RepID=UPI0005CADAB6|nr:DEAD/DEAH box helicase family protein [Thiomicrospira microaerophila]